MVTYLHFHIYNLQNISNVKQIGTKHYFGTDVRSLPLSMLLKTQIIKRIPKESPINSIVINQKLSARKQSSRNIDKNIIM